MRRIRSDPRSRRDSRRSARHPSMKRTLVGDTNRPAVSRRSSKMKQGTTGPVAASANAGRSWTRRSRLNHMIEVSPVASGGIGTEYASPSTPGPGSPGPVNPATPSVDAAERSRTSTSFRTQAPQACASTNSATAAGGRRILGDAAPQALCPAGRVLAVFTLYEHTSADGASLRTQVRYWRITANDESNGLGPAKEKRG